MDVDERLYSIGAALGHVLRNKLDILVKLLGVPGAKDDEANRIMSLCKKDAKKNLEEFMNEFGREPDTFGDFLSYRRVENLLRNEGIRLSAEDAIEAYAQGDRKIKKLFDEKVDLEGIERIMYPPLLQGIHFGSSFPELAEKMYRKAYEDDKNFWTGKWHGLTIPEEFKVASLEETQRAVLQMVAAYASKCYPELVEPLGLGDFLEQSNSREQK
ncbi:unnamed protein product [marine sediment metagenome]|uniref:Uncharacterized protein n=1 Tax=marine sediment metagenome TaxID=412755 RepID=X1KBS5_9ZZZZ